MSKSPTSTTTPATRRGFFMGAAAVGAATVAVTTLPPSEAPVAKEVLPNAPEHGGGYSLSEHVKQYYQTTRV